MPRSHLGKYVGHSWEKRDPPFPDNGLVLTLPCWIELAPGSLAAGLLRKVFTVFPLRSVAAVLTVF